MGKVVLSISDVSARYQVNRSTVLRWFERNVISYYSVTNGKGKRRVIWLEPSQVVAFEMRHLVICKTNIQETNALLFFPEMVLARPCDLAEHYGLHLPTVLRWCERGLISHYNLTLLTGGKRTIRFHPDHISAFEVQALVPAQVMPAARDWQLQHNQ